MKISVITVSYNSSNTIADTLHSVAMQSYTNVEHLIIDGKSKDNTVQLVEGFKSLRVKLISEPDRGIYDAMNKGLSLASGDIVGFLNSDDYYADETVLEKISSAFLDPTIDACYADLNYVSQDKTHTVRKWRSKTFEPGDFAKGWCPAHPTFYVRSAFLKRLGLFDTSFGLAADMEFMMRYMECGNIRTIYIPYVFVSMRLGGATNKNAKNIIQQNKEIFSALEKNGINFSKITFIINKVFNRMQQYLSSKF